MPLLLWLLALLFVRFYKPPAAFPQPPFAFAIDRNGRDEYLYSEGDHTLTFYAEMLVGPISRALDFGSIQGWLPPHDNETLSDTDRERILQNICAHFDRNGITYRV